MSNMCVFAVLSALGNGRGLTTINRRPIKVNLCLAPLRVGSGDEGLTAVWKGVLLAPMTRTPVKYS